MMRRLPIARYGYREIAISGFFWAILSIASFFTEPFFVPVFALGMAGVLYFFRDPHRTINCGGPGQVLSPADGRVADISEVVSAPYLDKRCLCIGVFMSVFDVHVNRCPLAGTVEYVEHFPGRHHDARSDKGRMDNEHNYVCIAAPDGKKVLINQVAGLIARRIVCLPKEGDHLEKGEKIGMIKFGSRMEVYIPVEYAPVVDVGVGDRVKAGIDILADMDLTERA